MAFILRRAFPAGKLPFLIYPRWIGNLSHLTPVLYGESASGATRNDTKDDFARSGLHPLWVNRRGFAKGRKSNEDNSATIQDFQDIGPSVKLNTNSLMEAAIAALSRELGKIRTGRASAGMLDHIIVDTGSVKTPLNRVAVVSVIDAHTLSVTPYDPNTLKAIENAIVSSPLGINPTPGDQRLIALIPPLTKENIQAMCKVVMKYAEDGKQSIRRARQKLKKRRSSPR